MKIPCVELGPVESLDKEFFVEECDMGNTSSAKDDGANRVQASLTPLTDAFVNRVCNDLKYRTARAGTDYTAAFDDAIDLLEQMERDRAELVTALQDLLIVCDEELDRARVPEMGNARALLRRFSPSTTEK